MGDNVYLCIKSMSGTVRPGLMVQPREIAVGEKSIFDPAVTDEWKPDGADDRHCHLDRAYTWDEKYYGHEGGRSAFTDAPLRMKQDAVGKLHTGLAFTYESLWQRMEYVICKKIAAHEKSLWAITDCSPDIGDRSFKIVLALKKKYAKQIDIKVGAYAIFGFKTFTGKERDRFELIEALAPKADFLVGLPERDALPGHEDVGFGKHISVMVDLAIKHDIPLQMHLDQTGLPTENGTERFIEAIRWLVTDRYPVTKRPRIAAVHEVSPASYTEDRFGRLVKGHVENDIDFILCGHAASSMRPMRNVNAPLHNLLARVFEMLLAGVHVGLGTDNIRALFMPRPVSPLLVRELDHLASDLRFYDAGIFYKLLKGEPFNNGDLAIIKRWLDGNYAAWGTPQGADAFLAMNPAFQG